MLQQMRSAAKWVWLFVAVAFVGGFLVVETSGLLGSAPLTPTTAVAEVNGREILYNDWQSRVQQAMQSQQNAGRALVPADRPGDFNQGLMELGATVCLPRKPRCGSSGAGNRCRPRACAARCARGCTWTGCAGSRRACRRSGFR